MFLSSQDWAQSQKHLNTYQDKFLPSESTKGQSQNKKRKTINCICSADYPAAIAPAIAIPSAADFPRPRAASKATVLRRVLSKIASRNVMTALPYFKHKDMIDQSSQSEDQREEIRDVEAVDSAIVAVHRCNNQIFPLDWLE